MIHRLDQKQSTGSRDRGREHARGEMGMEGALAALEPHWVSSLWSTSSISNDAQAATNLLHDSGLSLFSHRQRLHSTNLAGLRLG